MRCYTMVLLLVGLTPMSLLSANRPPQTSEKPPLSSALPPSSAQ